MPLGLVPAALALAPPVGGKVVPPPGFRAAEGVQSAWLIGEGPFGCTPRRISGSAAQRAGKRYERKALAYLAGVLGRSFAPSRWFRFYDGTKLRYCQVDGLLRDDEGIVIFEVKVSFTADAYWQLRKLYEPVVRCALAPKRVQLVVVCRSFDPAIAFPEPYEHTQLFADWRTALTKIGVFQWRT